MDLLVAMRSCMAKEMALGHRGRSETSAKEMSILNITERTIPKGLRYGRIIIGQMNSSYG